MAMHLHFLVFQPWDEWSQCLFLISFIEERHCHKRAISSSLRNKCSMVYEESGYLCHQKRAHKGTLSSFCARVQGSPKWPLGIHSLQDTPPPPIYPSPFRHCLSGTLKCTSSSSLVYTLYRTWTQSRNISKGTRNNAKFQHLYVCFNHKDVSRDWAWFFLNNFKFIIIFRLLLLQRCASCYGEGMIGTKLRPI